jgi:pilus assembly protein CpaE
MQVARLKILIATRSKLAANHLNKSLANHRDFVVETRIMGNGHCDPLQDVSEIPDLLLLHDGPDQSELRYLLENGQRNQIPLIVCGPGDNPESMRLAMQAGARDYLPAAAPDSDLIASLLRVKEETLENRGSKAGKLIVMLNGKGGSGASFLATNLAHSFVVDGKKQATLVDLDIQFGGLCRYLDITPKVGILEALDVSTQLDDMSAEAYTCEHSSGLRLLAAPSKRLVLPSEISVAAIDALLDVFLACNDYVVADSPNRLDALTEYFLERADRIILVVQQSLPHVQDAARMLQMLTDEVGIGSSRVDVVVNRFSKNSQIELDDIQKALRQEKLITVPNQYKVAAESIDSGIPVADISRNAPLTRGIRNLRASIDNTETKPAENFLARALPNILRS